MMSDSGTAEDAGLLIRRTSTCYPGEPLVARPGRAARSTNHRSRRAWIACPVRARPSSRRRSRHGSLTVPADQLGDRIGTVVGHDRRCGAPVARRARRGHRDRRRASCRSSARHPSRRSIHAEAPTPEIPPIAILMIVLAVIGALVPVAVFVSTATRLSAARREQRLAALRLVGATSLQVTRLAAVEALFVSVIGRHRRDRAVLPLTAAGCDGPARRGDLVPGIDPAAAPAGRSAAAPGDPGRRCRQRPSWRCGGSSSRRSASSAGRPRGCPGCVRAVPLVVFVVVLIGAMAVLRGQRGAEPRADRPGRRRVRRRHPRDRPHRSVADVPRRPSASRAAGWRLDAARVAPADGRSAWLVRRDRRA